MLLYIDIDIVDIITIHMLLYTNADMKVYPEPVTHVTARQEPPKLLGLLLLTWFNFNPSMDK